MENNAQVMKEFDINHCFADDVKYENATYPDFWKTFWEQNDGLGGFPTKGSVIDPDARSKKLYEFHKFLYENKTLPIGGKFDFEISNYPLQLRCRLPHRLTNFYFGSDTLVNTYCNWKYIRQNCILQIKKYEFDDNEIKLKEWGEEYIRKAYTIGNMIIFPKKPSINCARGRCGCIHDRLDLTIECIRRHYLQDDYNPLNKVLQANAIFFELFGTGEEGFRNYIDFFFLKPIVNDDYKVKSLLPREKVQTFLCETNFERPLPQDRNEYKLWRKNSMEFIDERNKIICDYLHKQVL
ncbi:MAG: hypothetical protein K2I95_11720 [Treponemataceae bacterium]|nr:hypothetical protein [Treponemataceae bacterium]